jgi:hypothetical protein
MDLRRFRKEASTCIIATCSHDIGNGFYIEESGSGLSVIIIWVCPVEDPKIPNSYMGYVFTGKDDPSCLILLVHAEYGSQLQITMLEL